MKSTNARRFVGAAKALAFWPAVWLILALDVVTKYLAHTRLPPHMPREILGDTLRLTLAYNPGAAFGLHLGPYSRWVFTALTIAALVVLARLYRETRPGDGWRALALGLVVGGALGNLVNRLWSTSGVVDWIDVGLGAARWPIFNVADIGVSVGAFLLAWVLWGEDRRVRDTQLRDRSEANERGAGPIEIDTREQG